MMFVPEYLVSRMLNGRSRSLQLLAIVVHDCSVRGCCFAIACDYRLAHVHHIYIFLSVHDNALEVGTEDHC